MAEKRPIQDLMGVTMEKMREMVDVQTIIGDPIVVSDKVTIVPVSKVSYGFASGGSDLPVKTNPKDLFGGGAGARRVHSAGRLSGGTGGRRAAAANGRGQRCSVQCHSLGAGSGRPSGQHVQEGRQEKRQKD